MLGNALILLGLIGALPGSALARDPADDPAPFAIRDQNPFILIYGLPPLRGRDQAPRGRVRTEVTFDLANNSRLVDGEEESISLDGETYRLALSASYGLSDRLEVGVEVPLIFHRAGALDDLIEGWHDLLGLTNAERDETPSNSLDYSYRFQGEEPIAIRSGQQGLGDVRLFAATTLYRAEGGARDLGLELSLELPTGDAARLLGSGSVDLALSVAGVERGLGRYGLTGFGQVGLLAIGDGDVLTSRQRHAVPFGGLGLAWRAGSRIDLEVQLDCHGPFYESALAQLDSTALQLTFGGTLHVGRATAIDLAVGENLFTDTIPDFLIHLRVSHLH